MKRVWFYRPEPFCWLGVRRSLLPIAFGGDEFNRHTLVLGWSALGRVIIAYYQCTDELDRCTWTRSRPRLHSRIARSLEA